MSFETLKGSVDLIHSKGFIQSINWEGHVDLLGEVIQGEVIQGEVNKEEYSNSLFYTDIRK